MKKKKTLIRQQIEFAFGIKFCVNCEDWRDPLDGDI